MSDIVNEGKECNEGEECDEGEECFDSYIVSSMETTALSWLRVICDLDVDYRPVDEDEENLLCCCFFFFREGLWMYQ